MALLDMNMNMNMNMGFVSPAGGGRGIRVRYNSDVESRLVNPNVPADLVPPVSGTAQNYPSFHEYWDADLQSYMYLADYLQVTPNWLTACKTAATNYGIAAKDMTQQQLGDEVQRILELALEREDRFLEIIDQDDAAGSINYWLGMLKIDPARHKATYGMVCVARRIGEHVVMCLKGHFKSPRPSQLCPAITPMIDPPATPTFPAGHAVQAYLISYLLAYSFSNQAGTSKLPQHTLPPANSCLADFMVAKRPKGPLFDLAARVSENRIVAGIHYPTDIDAGRAVATQIFRDLQNVTSVWGAGTLRDAVRAEFPQYAV
jgi:membrane-associated phospholipid phosphatase